MTGRMTPDDLDRWQALADKATCGPWQVLLDGRSWAGTVVVADAAGHPVTVVSSAPDDDDAKDDAEFIAATRDAVPALIAEVQRLREQEARARPDRRQSSGWRPGPVGWHDGYQWCGYCSSLDSDGDLEREWSWPCATIRALDGGDDE